MSRGNNNNTGGQEWRLNLTCSQETLARYEELIEIDNADLPEVSDSSHSNKVVVSKPDQQVDLADGLFSCASYINGFINIVLKLCGAGILLYTLLYIFAGD